MAEGARLESVLGVKPYAGSNPALSAISRSNARQRVYEAYALRSLGEGGPLLRRI